MAKGLHVPNEIGQLRRVCLHRPGDELLNLPPSELDRLLFEDVPFLEDAQAEHDAFAQTLRDQGVEVVYLEDLVAEESLEGKIKAGDHVTLDEADGKLVLHPADAAAQPAAEAPSETND